MNIQFSEYEHRLQLVPDLVLAQYSKNLFLCMPPSRPLRSWSLFLLACKWSVYAALRVCLLGKSVPVIASSVVLRTYTNVCGIIILERAIFLHLFRLFPCVVCGWSRPVTNRHLFWQPVTDRVYWTCMGKGHLLHVLVVLSSFFLFLSNVIITLLYVQSFQYCLKFMHHWELLVFGI